VAWATSIRRLRAAERDEVGADAQRLATSCAKVRT
jgi:hypothetical protein